MEEQEIGFVKTLAKVLARMATQESVQSALGVQDATRKHDTFWKGQAHAAVHRFYLYCLRSMNESLTQDRMELDEAATLKVQAAAEAFLSAGLTYTAVRTWFLNEGQFLFNLELDAKAERARLASTGLRVLLLKGSLTRPGYLAFDANGEPRLELDIKNAHVFSVTSATQCAPEYLAGMTKHFVHPAKLLGAAEVKILAGAR